MEIFEPVVVCDKCHPGEDIFIDNGAVLNQPTHGYSVGYSTEQMLENGWEEREYGLICPVCVVQEKEQAALDEATGAFSGATGMSNLLRPDTLVDTEVEKEAQQIEMESFLSKEKQLPKEAEEPDAN